MPQRGDPLAISARDWTDMQRVVDKFRNRGVSFQAETMQSTYRSPAIVKVLNATGAPLEHCGIVGLGEPVILPIDNEMEFARNIAFRIEPPLPGRWGVLQSPVAAGEISTAIVAGVAACKLNVTSEIELNRFADAVAPDFTELSVSDSTGNAQILWRAGGTGSQWAIIRIGNTACAERLERFVMLSDWSEDGFAVARFTLIEAAASDMVGIVEDPLGIFADQIGLGNSGLATRTSSGRNFVIQAACEQEEVAPSAPLGSCVYIDPTGNPSCSMTTEADCAAIAGTWTSGGTCS